MLHLTVTFIDKLPTFTSLKVEMKTSLIEKILFCDFILKVQLYDMIKVNKPHQRQHLIDESLAECRHRFVGWLFNQLCVYIL
jgi:hypothetical protein